MKHAVLLSMVFCAGALSACKTSRPNEVSVADFAAQEEKNKKLEAALLQEFKTLDKSALRLELPKLAAKREASNREIVEKLPRKDYNSVLTELIERRDIERLTDYASDLEAGELDKPLESGYTPLTLAITRRDTDVAIALINAGANVNKAADGGYSPLHAASYTGNFTLVKHLVDAGGNVNAKDMGMGGVTPLIQASLTEDVANGLEKQARENIVLFLIQHGADASVVTDLGQNALLKPAAFGYEGAVEALIAAKADVNVKTHQAGFSPLLVATLYNHQGIVRRLLAAGADPKIKNASGKTPRMIAESKGYTEVVNMLFAAEQQRDPATGTAPVIIE